MRTVVDHHVDRPGVEAQQCVQLTGTNRSIGLNALMTNALPRGGHRQTNKSSLLPLSFAGLVAVARSLNPIPSRTRPLNSSAPMVLCLKTWESRSLPGLQRTMLLHRRPTHEPRSRAVSSFPGRQAPNHAKSQTLSAGWSSPVARQAHNLKVVSSNLAPATRHKAPHGENRRGFLPSGTTPCP